MNAVPDVGDRDPAEALTRITLRPIANPLPLGFLALAAATPVKGRSPQTSAARSGSCVKVEAGMRQVQSASARSSRAAHSSGVDTAPPEAARDS